MARKNSKVSVVGQGSNPAQSINAYSPVELINHMKGINQNMNNISIPMPAVTFGNKNALLVFAPESKKTVKVGIDANSKGRPWETTPYFNGLNIIMNKANPWFEVIQQGMYLHHTIETIVQGRKDPNAGYVSHSVLEVMINKSLVSHKLNDNGHAEPGIYRLHWNGLFFTASLMPWVQYVADEPDYVKHDRRARNLVLALEDFRQCSKNGINIRLFWGEKQQPRADQVSANYVDYLSDNFEAIQGRMSKGITNAKTYESLRRNGQYNTAQREDGKEMAPKSNSFRLVDGEIDVLDLVGKTIQFVNGETTLARQWEVTLDQDDIPNGVLSARSVEKTMKENFLKLAVIGEEAIAAAPKKATKKARKSAKTLDSSKIETVA